jgi:four helix bundle protein
MKDETKATDPISPVDLRERTTMFALRIVRLVTALPRSATARVMGDQVLRSGTSVGAQYREAHRARSQAEFVSKMQSSLQELDETDYWLELMERADIIKPKLLARCATKPTSSSPSSLPS